MKRKSYLTTFGLVVIGLFLFALLAQSQPPGEQFDTAPPGVAIQNDKLFVALPLVNTGAGGATSVTVTGIHLGSLHRVRPADLPFPVGDIAAGQSTLIQLGFIAPVGGRPAKYPLHVHGKYTLGGRMKHFEVHVMIRRPHPSEGQRDAGQATVAPQTANGAIYPPSDIGFHPDENNQDPGPPVPEGDLIGSRPPDNPPVNVAAPGSPAGLKSDRRPLAPNDPVTFVRAGTHLFPNTLVFLDPSGASADVQEDIGGPLSRLVFLTGNTYALLSTDGGGIFTQLDPTTIFPNFDSQGKLFDGGLCCDQVIHYIPSIDRVVWLMQFFPQTIGTDSKGNPILGLNRLRLASASPSQIIATGGTVWTYWDMTSATFGLGNGWMDYPDLAWTGSFLDIGVDEASKGLFVIRAPLGQIQNSQTLNLQFTSPSGGGSFTGHLAQDSPDAAYWFANPTLDSTKIFEWLDSSASYSWRSLSVDPWQNGKNDYASPTPDGGVDWLGSNNSGTLGATVREDVDLGSGSSRRTIKTAHGAGRDGNFPQPYVRLLDIVKLTSGGQVTWSKTESQIWNPTFAFALPYLATNSNGEVGISLAFGGGGNHATPVAGFVGDSTFFYAGQSTTTISRWGDYSAIRRHWPNQKLFSVSDYYLIAPNVDFPSGQTLHQYRLFGRTADVGGTF
jgi:hypothetical protein